MMNTARPTRMAAAMPAPPPVEYEDVAAIIRPPPVGVGRPYPRMGWRRGSSGSGAAANLRSLGRVHDLVAQLDQLRADDVGSRVVLRRPGFVAQADQVGDV